MDLAPGVTLTTDGPDGAPGGGPGGGIGGDRLAAHPLANISVRQKVVPLGQRISHVGARVPVGGAQTLNLNLTTPQGLGTAPVTELFAPAQFIDLPGEQRLSAPSFQPMTAGCRLAPAAAAGAGPSTNCQGMVATLEVTQPRVAAETGAPAAAVTPPGGGS